MARRAHGEGGITLRKDGRHQGSYYVDTGKERERRYVYGKTHKEAADKVFEMRQRYGGGLLYDAELLTVAEYMDRWLESIKGSVKEKTWVSYEGTARLHISAEVGALKLAKLTPLHVQNLYAVKLAGGLSSSSVNNVHRVLRRALNCAVKWGLLTRNVCAMVDPPRSQRHEMRTLTVEEVQRLLQAVRDDRLEAMYVLEVCTGVRFGEVLGLLWEDLDLKHGAFHLRRRLIRIKGGGYYLGDLKDSDARRIALPPEAIAALEVHRKRQLEERVRRAAQWKDNGLVFCTDIGTPLDQRNVYRRHFKPLLKRAGLPDIRFHDLRHTYATLMIGEGVSVRTIQRVLGHYTASYTLDRYCHVLREHEDYAAATVQDLFWTRSLGS